MAATMVWWVGMGCGVTVTGGRLEEAIVAFRRKMDFGATKVKLFEVPGKEDLISPTQTLDYLAMDSPPTSHT